MLIKSIKEMLITLIVNLALLISRTVLIIYSVTVWFASAFQVIDFLVSGEWQGTSLASVGFISQTQFVGYDMLVNWFYELHILLSWFVIANILVLVEFVLELFIDSDKRWGDSFFN